MIEISAELKGHFLRLYQMAMTDSDFSPLEWKMLYEFALERGVEKEALDRILLQSTGKIEIPESLETRIEYLYDLARMVWADGVVTEDERNTLKKYCRKFEFLEENIDAMADYLLTSVKEGKTKMDLIKDIETS